MCVCNNNINRTTSHILHITEASVALDCETVPAAADARQVILNTNISGHVYLLENYIMSRYIKRTILYYIDLVRPPGRRAS